MSNIKKKVLVLKCGMAYVVVMTYENDENERRENNRKWPVTQKCRNKKITLRQNVENLIWTGLGCLEAIIIKKLLVSHNNTSTLTIYYNRTTKFQKNEHIWKKPKLIHYF
jgi:hypothetical protein